MKLPLFVGALIGAVALLSGKSEKLPNIVFILADDLGWSDTTLYGTTDFFETPHIQALADRGTLLTNAYSASPVCSPTRASIMTGKWPARFGISQARGNHEEVRLVATVLDEEPPQRNALEVVTASRFSTEEHTLAEFLQDNGYHTAHFGKWHLGHVPYSPLENGFHIDVPHTAGGFGNNFLAPWGNPDLDHLDPQPGDHIEDVMAEEAANYIREYAAKDQPFFLNYWAFSIHSPWYAKEEYAEYFLAKRAPMNPQSNPVYAGMVKSFDDAIGTLVAALKDAGVFEETLIVFTSDNGGNTWGPPTSKTGPEFGADIPGTSNYPFRDGKGSLYEGGIRVPTFFVWPGHIQSGNTVGGEFNSVDFYPTIASLIGGSVDIENDMDGMDLSSVLEGTDNLRNEHFFYYPHYSGMNGGPVAAVKVGDWKLLRYFYGNQDQSHRSELYDLNNDIYERQNLASRYPKRLSSMEEVLDRYLEETEAVLPLPNPAYPKVELEKLEWR